MPGTLLCLGDAMINKIISPCPQRSSGRDKIVSKSDSSIIDVRIKSCGSTEEGTINCVEDQGRKHLSKVINDE